MYQIELTIRNPQNGESRMIKRRTDEDAFSQQKWNGAYSTVQGLIDELKASASTDPVHAEPPIW